MTDSLPAIGCAGAGTLGAAIMRRLVDYGHPVLVWNRSPARLAPLSDLARAHGAPMPVTSLVEELHRKLVLDGLGDKDNSQMVQMYRGK